MYTNIVTKLGCGRILTALNLRVTTYDAQRVKLYVISGGYRVPSYVLVDTSHSYSYLT